jgi:hypothetical protein
MFAPGNPGNKTATSLHRVGTPLIRQIPLMNNGLLDKIEEAPEQLGAMKKAFDSSTPLWYKVKKIGAKNLKKGG